MKKLLTQLIIVANLYVGLFHTDLSAITLPDFPALPAWIQSITQIGSSSPIGEPGFRVAIFEETAERGSITKEQLSALNGTALRAYLSSHCVKEASGPAWRILDKDADLAADATWVAKAKASLKPENKTPVIVAGNGSKGWIKPLVDEAQALAELKKLGGE